jgi:competence ComEA-like helix-hairpin-helix protein
LSLLKEYFSFTKGQRTAIVSLLSLIVVFSVVNFLMPYFIHPKTEMPLDDLKQLMAKIKVDSSQNNYYSSNEKYVPTKLTPFNFNPNELDSNGFIRLGLRAKLAHTILNYRNKGGRFYNKEGFQKMYGLHEEEYKQLEAYIAIPETNKFQYKPKEVVSIELNSADTMQLNKLRGIGNKLSMNIVKYRTELGGFTRVEQLKEVWGISTETFEMIKGNCHVNSKSIKKINLNEATLAEINVHPYLKGEIAKALVNYRKEHNYEIDNLLQIKEIELINDEKFRKIVPYLEL